MRPVDETPTTQVDYAALSAGYGALLGALVLGAREQADPVVRQEIPALGLASFALSKIIAKEKVENWMREPFVEETPQGRRPKGTGMRYAIGELLNCTRCVGAWSSLGLVALRVTRPREAKVVTAVLATSALNDFLQTGFTWACARANDRSVRAPGE
jgi:hypothetical protein